MSEPSRWAMEQARRIYLFGECKCDHNGACDLHTDIARDLDAALELGRSQCHDDRDHADRDLRALYAIQVGAVDYTHSTPCWDDIIDAAREEGRRERDDLDQRNAAILADLTDAVYGKGTAEAKGYPRGMVAKVQRVFGRLRRIKREESRRSQRFFIADLDALLKEVK